MATRNPREPQPPAGKPTCPRWLTPAERVIFRRLVELLDEMGLAAKTDQLPLARYVRMLGKWITYPDADCREALRLAPHLLRLEVEFGLTPASRSRIVASPRQPQVVRTRQRREGLDDA